MLPPKFTSIYVQRSARLNHKQAASNILNRYPEAKVTYVDSHWRIPELVNIDPAKWIEVKKNVLVLGELSNLINQPNGRSTDFIAPSHANGCLSSCQYCYISRRKGNSNPLTVFLNIDNIAQCIVDHVNGLGPKTKPNQCDPHYWTYDIGNANDVSLDLFISDNPLYLIDRIQTTPYGKLSFATKTVNLDPLLSVKPGKQTRIRFSLMPESIRKYVDIRTSSIEDRLEAMNVLCDHGYEIHANFSPVIMYGGDQWKHDWKALWELMNRKLSGRVKSQLKCEVIFLTHSADLHDINMQWNPKGEEYLWQPDIQQVKFDKPDVLCYRYDLKKANVEAFTAGIRRYLPYCEVRYAF